MIPRKTIASILPTLTYPFVAKRAGSSFGWDGAVRLEDGRVKLTDSETGIARVVNGTDEVQVMRRWK